eukprot:1160923-Pelagomonas_calceolata.AAC.5
MSATSHSRALLGHPYARRFCAQRFCAPLLLLGCVVAGGGRRSTLDELSILRAKRTLGCMVAGDSRQSTLDELCILRAKRTLGCVVA